ncbi:MAG: hypothetical protein AB7G40_08360 [Hyphomonadaceae bacterium]
MNTDSDEKAYAHPICLKCGGTKGFRVEDTSSNDSAVFCEGCGAQFGERWGEFKLAAAQAVLDSLKRN